MNVVGRISLGACAITMAMLVGPSLDAQRGPVVPLVDANHLRMNPSRPHYHDQDRYVTVIKGTWYTDEGDVFRPDKMIPIKTGGFMFHPAGYHHYDGAKDEEVVVQIMGMGPVKTIQTEVDANGKPVPARGATPPATPR